MSIPELKIESTQFERDLSKNNKPYAITIRKPEPLFRAFLISVMENKYPDSPAYKLKKKTDALLDQNTQNVLRITFGKKPDDFVEHIYDKFDDWVERQRRFGFVEGIKKAVEAQFPAQVPEIKKHHKIKP